MIIGQLRIGELQMTSAALHYNNITESYNRPIKIWDFLEQRKGISEHYQSNVGQKTRCIWKAKSKQHFHKTIPFNIIISSCNHLRSLRIFCIFPNDHLLLFYCILKPFSISTMIGGAWDSSRAEIICIFDVLFTERLHPPPHQLTHQIFYFFTCLVFSSFFFGTETSGTTWNSASSATMAKFAINVI